jgi:hypothetical protein
MYIHLNSYNLYPVNVVFTIQSSSRSYSLRPSSYSCHSLIQSSPSSYSHHPVHTVIIYSTTVSSSLQQSSPSSYSHPPVYNSIVQPSSSHHLFFTLFIQSLCIHLNSYSCHSVNSVLDQFIQSSSILHPVHTVCIFI